jgi:hypothetical protein
MQNKKLFVILGLLVLVVGGAAFIAGRLLNQKAGPAGSGGPLGNGGNIGFSIQIVPAEELPRTAPEVTGQFVERKDNTIVVSSVPLETGGGGVVMDIRNEGEPDGPSTSSNMTTPGPSVEVVITNETIIYRETTPPPSGGSNETIQQTVAEGTLDDLNSESMLRVWGRKSGDRVIAEILFYSSPLTITSP